MSPRTILITGANRGIGFSILQALAIRSPSDHCLLAARSTENGQLAIQELRKLGVQAEIDVVQLDVANESSIKEAEQEIRKQYGRLDIWLTTLASPSSKVQTAQTYKKATLRPSKPTLPASLL